MTVAEEQEFLAAEARAGRGKLIALAPHKTLGRLCALVSLESFDELISFHWHVLKFERVDGSLRIYAQRKIRKSDGGWTNIAMHRHLRGVAGIDHENGVSLDNRLDNLRTASKSQNGAGYRVLKANKPSPFRGVSPAGDKWRATITVDQAHIAIGLFDTSVEAALAYDAAALTHFGAFAQCNFNNARTALVAEIAEREAALVGMLKELELRKQQLRELPH